MKSLSRVIKSYQYDRVSGPHSGFPDTGHAPPGAAREESDEARQKAVMDRAFEKARQIVESAEAYKAQAIRETAEKSREEYEQADRRGYSDGFARGMSEGRKKGGEAGRREGYEEGKEKAQAESRSTLGELTLMIETVEKSKTDILRKFEGNIEELAFTIAKAILKRELSVDGDALRSIIVSATDSYRNQNWLRIHVSAKDADALLKTDGGIARDLANVSDSVKIVTDYEMDDGGCIIEMPDQVIDAGVDSQLSKMKTAIESSGQDKTG